MTNKQAGYDAEAKAADYLESQGFEIIDQNWHTRWCEIDIIAKKDKRLYFVEVKYRRSGAQGRGLDYITSGKLRQMSFAAEMWVGNNKWSGEYQLAALSIDDAEITLVTDITM